MQNKLRSSRVPMRRPQMQRRPLGSPLSQGISLLLLTGVVLSSADAASSVWTTLLNGSASGNWSDSINWAGGVVADGPAALADFSTLDVFTPSTISVDTPRTIGSITFGDTDPTSPGSWTLTNNGTAANVLTMSGGTPTITANGGTGATLTISTILAGTEGLTYAGNSTILMQGAVGHTYTGNTTLKGRVETTNVANTTLSVFGAASNSVTFDGGYFKIFNTTAATSAGTLANSLIVNTTGTLEMSGRSAVSGALTGAGTFNVITHFIRSDNTGNWSGFTGTLNVSSGDAGVSDFRQSTYNGFGGATLNLGTNANLYFTSNQAANGSTVVTIGALSGVSTAFLRGGPIAGRVTSFQIGAKNVDTEFAGAIVEATVGALSNLVKNGTGLLTLSGANSAYNGPTTINAGTLAVTALANGGSPSSIGQSANTANNLVINGGTLRYSGSGSSTDRLFTLGLTGGILESSGSGPVNFTNSGPLILTGVATRTLALGGTNTGANILTPIVLDGGAATNVTKTGAGTWALNGANTYSGITTINGGVLSALTLANGGVSSAIGQSSSLAANLVLDGGTLRYTGAATSTDRGFQVGPGGATIDASGTGSLAFTNPGGVEFSSPDVPHSITLTGTNSATNLLSAALGNSGAGATSLTKAGAGTWLLTSANTFTGGTTINGGILKVNNTTGSGTGTGSVTVNTTGTLAGSGIITGPVLVNTGAHLAPGDGVGTLTVGNLSLSTGTILDYEFNSTPGHDQVIVSSPGGLTINGGGFNLFSEGSTNKWTTPGSYHLLQFSGSLSGTGTSALSVLNPQTGLNYSFTAASGFIDLLITASSTLSNWTATTGGSWNSAANWTNGIPNARNDGATFLSSINAPATVTLDGDKKIGTLQFNSPIAYTISPGTSGTLILDSGASASQVTVLNGSHTIAAPVSLLSNTSVDVNKVADTLSITGVLSGTGTLTKTGPGTLSLSAQNTFSNGITLAAGALKIGHTAALGSGALTVSGPSSLLAGADALTPANPIVLAGGVELTVDTQGNTLTLTGIVNNPVGNGSLSKIGSGTLIPGDSNTYSGVTTIAAGTLAASTLADGGMSSSIGQSTNAAANLIINGGTLRYTGTGSTTDRLLTVGSTGATVAADGIGTVAFTNPGPLVFSGLNQARTFTLRGENTGVNSFNPVIVNNGTGLTTLTKAGGGSWTLNAANTFSGPTMITGGTLVLGNPLALQNSTLIYDTLGGTLDFGVLGAATFGALSGSQSLALQNSFQGLVALTVGTNNTNSIYGGVLSGPGSLTKVGSGILSLGAPNTYFGTTTINNAGGALKLLVPDAISASSNVVVNNPGGLQLGNGASLGSTVTAAVGANEFLDVPDAGAVAAITGLLQVGGGANQFRLGITGAGAILNVTGTVNIPNAASIDFLTRGNLVFSANSLYNAGGGITIGRATQAINVTFKDNASASIAGASGFGGGQANPAMTLTIQDTASFNLGVNSLDLNASSAATNQVTVNLNGGSLTTGGFFKTNQGASQLSTINFNGGILRAGSAGANFLPAFGGLTGNVQSGGALIDTNGFDVTVAAPLTHDPLLVALDGGLHKVSEGALTLLGDNSYNGPTITDAGSVIVSGSLSATVGLVANSSTIILGASDRVNDAATVKLNSTSTFNTAGFSETLGALTLGGDALLDLGLGNSVLHFANSYTSIWNPGTLTIAGWSGSSAGGGADQIFFGTDPTALTAAQLGQVKFVNPDGFTPGTYNAAILSTGEIVAAIPEPGTSALLLASPALLISRRHRRSRS